MPSRTDFTFDVRKSRAETAIFFERLRGDALVKTGGPERRGSGQLARIDQGQYDGQSSREDACRRRQRMEIFGGLPTQVSRAELEGEVSGNSEELIRALQRGMC